MKLCEELKSRVLDGYNVTKYEALELYLEPAEELYRAADHIRKTLAGNRVDLCSIVSDDRKIIKCLGLDIKVIKP